MIVFKKKICGLNHNKATKFNLTINSIKSFLKIFLFLAFTNTVAFSQVCGTSGIDGPENAVPPVNTYFPIGVNTTLTAGSKSIVLQPVPPNDPNYNLSYGITPIKSGDLILIIQMQDASFNYSNSNLYGSGTATSGPDNLGGTGYTGLNNSGKFEYVVATKDVPITGGVLNFRGGGVSKGCVNTYTNSNATATRGQRRFQVVRVPQYSNLVLTASITTPPYNGSVGGLIAFDVAGTMQFNGFIVDASERGFRGGYGPVAYSGANNSTLYVDVSSSTKSVGKGEGIAGTPRYMWDGFKQVDNGSEGLPAGSYGRGAPANGGGAGNDHNAGGGGGGNGGFGGLGGMGWQGIGGDVTPLTAGGRPGSSLPMDYSRLIMGGGGGGGDANNATSGVKGGVGGGIILINVEKIDGVGVIKANGGAGQAGAFGSAPDGAGGGGAGGTVFVRSLAPSPTAILTLEAKGGNGGNTKFDTGSVTPHGPGGGGGGGFIFTQIPSATITKNVINGVSGKTNNGAGIQHGAVDGTIGQASSFNTTDLPNYLQGGGSICYPALDVTLSEQNAGPSGARLAGTTATYKLRVTNQLSGGNAGDVFASIFLPTGFSLAGVTANLSGDVSGPTSPSFIPGSSGNISFGSYNIPPGDYVELTITVNIAVTVPSGIYHASGQATYLDPTRTIANPVRKITASIDAFPGSNTVYESGGLVNVPGANYNGDLLTSTAEDVYVIAVPPFSDCNALINGDFSFGVSGEYTGTGYFGWEPANAGDKVKIFNTLGLFQGAYIKSGYSLKQTIASINPSSFYSLSLNYYRETGCLIPSAAKISVDIIDANSGVVLTSQNLNAALLPQAAAIPFTTGVSTNSIIVKVTDNNSPSFSCPVYVDDFVITSPLSINLYPSNSSCYHANDGKITINKLSNAAGPYTVSYSSDLGLTYSLPVNSGIITSADLPIVFSGLSAGSYIIKVLDQNGCTTFRTTSITQPDELTLTGSNTPIQCYNGTSTVTLLAHGGTGTYQYSIDNGFTYQSTTTFPNLGEGNYNFLVKDANNCTETFSISISQPATLSFSGTYTPITCPGGTSKVTLSASGGTGTYEYSLDGTNFQASNIFTDVLAGPQVFLVKDQNSCWLPLTLNIPEPAAFVIDVISTNILCNGGTSKVTLNVTGGTAPYLYSRDGTTFQSSNIFDNLAAGDYTFTVKDANGCSFSTPSQITITEPTKLDLAASKTDILCNGGTSTVTLTATGGTGTYQYSRDGTTFQSSNIFNG
ncbi:SprB repeat-containing protein, partial [Pedobacter sp. SD-b]|nr:SprB repeat-containing protein [Pedobacter segetis]